MKHISILAAMLLVMGTALFPGCDEGDGIDGVDMLMMQYLANSKYYLRFDVDYDNDAVVDEHVDMRVTQHFYSRPSLFYEADFAGRYADAWIHLPNDANIHNTYTSETVNFTFGYDHNVNYYDYDYQDVSGHDFEFIITEWNNEQRTIKAQFSGDLVYDHGDPTQDIITIFNGELFAKVVRYNGE